MPASITNPHKQFQFQITIGMMDPMLAQKVTLPSPEVDVVEHGDRNHLIKTAGLIKFDTLKVEKISWGGNIYSGDAYTPQGNLLPSMQNIDNIWKWIHRIQNCLNGGGALPSQYKQDIIVTKYGTDGVSTIGSWRCSGAWPSKINGLELSRVDSENTLESIEFALDEFWPLAKITDASIVMADTVQRRD